MTDINCPKCNQKIFFNIVCLFDKAQLSAIKYKIKCESCNHEFETAWRENIPVLKVDDEANEVYDNPAG